MTSGLQIGSLAVEKALLVSEIELLDVEITSLVPERPLSSEPMNLFSLNVTSNKGLFTINEII